MSRKNLNTEKLHKFGNFSRGLALFAFIAIAGIATYVVVSANNTIQSGVLASDDDTPRSWSSFGTVSLAEGEIAGQMIEESLVQYTTSVTNTSNSDTLFITHLASYYSERNGDKAGFVPLTDGALEYTYTPEDEDSWSEIGISAPSNNLEGFKLSNQLALGVADSNTDTVYFRFKVSTSGDDDDIVKDKVSYLATDQDGDTTISSSQTLLSTANVGTAIAYENSSSNSKDGVESSYTKPLGVSSSVAGTTVVADMIDSPDSTDFNIFASSQFWIFAILAVFAIGFVGYLVVCRF